MTPVGASEIHEISSLDMAAGTIELMTPWAQTHTAGSIVSCPPTPAPTMVVLDDPHVTNLQGERFDIRMPSSDCVLLRVPFSNEDPEQLKLSVSLDTDGVSPSGLYVKSVALSGSLLDHQVVHARPRTRNAAGSSQAGDKTWTDFSLQVGNSIWRDFHFPKSEGVGADIPGASVGVLTPRFSGAK
ncbi:unnamed protein product [Prorocentrum cordatum]|uniref:Uncharacterized protein n=1 Tax=Prorocentrum cordatum TaxID=2364126 RepID=A0ABN9R7Y6_9DINO|nr:unnamed protein product [Polarella glacialis]